MAKEFETPQIIALGDEWARLENLILAGGLSDRQISSIRMTQDSLHQKAEALRSVFGYSGGADGSGYIDVTNNYGVGSNFGAGIGLGGTVDNSIPNIGAGLNVGAGVGAGAGIGQELPESVGNINPIAIAVTIGGAFILTKILKAVF